MSRPTDHPPFPAPPEPEPDPTALEALQRLTDAVETSIPSNRRGHHVNVALRVARKALGRQP